MRVRLGFASTARLLADQAGIVTVQMVVFSIMLFGGVGLMMDFGRAYSAHSQMQGYIDQVALAAAQELDGQSDAITRATNSAAAVAKGSSFTTGNGNFSIKELVFMRAAPTETDGSFSYSRAATFATSNPENATHVLAVANTESVALTLLNFGSADSTGVDDFDVGAFAVATTKTVSCGGMSTLVMCNPFENRSDTSWEAEIANGEGFRMWLTADTLDGSKVSNYNADEQQIRLGLLKSPDSLMEVRNLVCSDTSLLPGYGGGAFTTEELKDICMLATVQTGLSCVNDRVAYKAAHPATVTTGLGPIFDMYDGPLAEIVDGTTNPSLASFPTMLSWASTRAELFYPDKMPGHGRMSRQDYDIMLDDEIAEVNANPAIPPFLKPGRISVINQERALYGDDPNIETFSRLNYVFPPANRTEWGPAPVQPCLQQDSGVPNCTGIYPAIYDSEPGQSDIDAYAAGLYSPYATLQYMDANPGVYANWWDVPQGSVDKTFMSAGHSTYYSFYANEERQVAGMMAEDATLGHSGGVGAGAAQMPLGYGVYGTQTGAKNFSDVHGASMIGDVERRRQRVTVVNCDAATSYAAETGASASGYSDTYFGEVVDVADIFLVTPPQVNGCSPALSDDPHENYLCDNTQVTKVNLDVEFVDSASRNPNGFNARFYAVLVH